MGEQAVTVTLTGTKWLPDSSYPAGYIQQLTDFKRELQAQGGGNNPPLVKKCARQGDVVPEGVSAFNLGEAKDKITQFCSDKKYWDTEIVPAVSFGTGMTKDGRHKALGADDSFTINDGKDNLWVGLGFSEDACVGSFAFALGKTDDDKINHCTDRFMELITGVCLSPASANHTYQLLIISSVPNTAVRQQTSVL